MNVSEYEAMFRLEDSLWWYAGMRHIAERIVDGRLPPGGRILDAGCGTGGNLCWLARFGQPFGADVSPHAVSFCAQRGLTTVAQASVLALPFPDRTFDLVTSFDVVYHLGVQDDVQALREMRRVLKPGGWAVVRVPALEQLRSVHDEAVHTRQRYSLAELRDKLRRAGFQVVRATYANFLLFLPAALVRLVQRARRHGAPAGAAGAEARSDVRPAPRLVNEALRRVLALEAAALARFDLPGGLSALALAQRPAVEAGA